MITITILNDDDSEEEHNLPSTNEVCGECGGDGFVLCEGMRGHAYSQEEFAESFDEEEAAEYFTRGGRYDQQCPCCKGKNVVPIVDEKRLTAEQKVLFERWNEQEEQKARWDSEDRATMRMECGYRE